MEPWPVFYSHRPRLGRLLVVVRGWVSFNLFFLYPSSKTRTQWSEIVSTEGEFKEIHKNNQLNMNLMFSLSGSSILVLQASQCWLKHPSLTLFISLGRNQKSPGLEDCDAHRTWGVFQPPRECTRTGGGGRGGILERRTGQECGAGGGSTHAGNEKKNSPFQPLIY